MSTSASTQQGLLLRFSQALGLKAKDPACEQAFAHSWLTRLAVGPFNWLHSRLAPAVQHSQLAKYLPSFNLFLVMLLLFTLPFAESKASGLLVMVVAFFSFLRLLLFKEPLPVGALFSWVLFFVAWGAVASAFSPFLMLSLYGYAKLLTYFLTYLCFLINLRSLPQIRLSIWVIMLSALMVSLYGLYQWHIKVPPLALWDDPDSNYKITRVYSFLGNPNLLGGYLLPTLCLSGFFCFERIGWRRLLFAGATLAQVLCLYFTYSRGAWIALAACGGLGFAACLLIYWRQIRQSKLLSGLLLAGVVVGLLGGAGFALNNPALLERINSLFSGQEHSSNNFRVNVWMSSLAIIKEYGWTGVGLGSKVFQKIYTYYMATGFQALSTYNVFLEVWLEMGIVGLLAFVALLISHAGRCLWGMLQQINLSVRLLLAASLCGLAGLMIHGMVDTVFYRPPVQIMFWYFLALITVVSQNEYLQPAD